jgi:penicillin-binding protein 1A
VANIHKPNGDTDKPEINGADADKTGVAGGKVKGRILGMFLVVVILIAALLASTALATGGFFLYRLYQTLPTHSKLQNVEQSLVSKVFDRNGALIHEFSVEKRFWVPIEKIPAELQNAVIAIEDRDFEKHWGINVRRIIGAVIVNVATRSKAQGASTLTQQLARNLYLTADKSFIRKIREILTAIQLERSYTKTEILELYLNQVYLGAGVYGVQAAAEHYFSKDVDELTLAECAVIAGSIQLPERYRPDRADNITRITDRRNTVLRAMRATKAIDKNTMLAAINEEVIANPKIYRPPAAPYFMEMVRKYISDKYGDELLYNGGLSIHTTLDPTAQDSTEKSMAKQVKSLQRRLNRMFLDDSEADKKLRIKRETFIASFDSLYAENEEEYKLLPDSVKLRQAQMGVVALDVKTGAIRVLIGGRDFQESKFNRAMQAKRQPGSSFKPFVYAAALENGFTPATVVLDQPITLITDEGEWRPENYDRSFSGPLSVRDALAKSNNLVAIQVFNKVGGQIVVDYAAKMGIKQKLLPVPSLAIGACEVLPIEMISAYATFANRGIQAEPYWVEKVLDKNGRVLEQMIPKEREVLSPQIAFLMNSLLSSVVCCGTGASIRGLGFSRPAAGKTGTTNDYSDAWFIGYTPQIACGVWAGVDERRSLGKGVTGSMAAIPVWVDAMITLHKGVPVEDFRRPEGTKALNICAQSYGLATASCPKTKVEYFLVGSPVEACTIHGSGSSLRNGGIDVFGPSRRGGGTNGSGGRDAQPRKRSMMF